MNSCPEPPDPPVTGKKTLCEEKCNAGVSVALTVMAAGIHLPPLLGGEVSHFFVGNPSHSHPQPGSFLGRAPDSGWGSTHTTYLATSVASRVAHGSSVGIWD